MRSAVEGVGWPAIPDRQGALLASLLIQFQQTECLSADKLKELQFQQIRLLLAHAVASTPYYRNNPDYSRWLSCPDQARWSTLPVISRTELADNNEQFFSPAPADHGSVNEGRTSGSTGQPIKARETALQQAFWQAIAIRDHYWHQRWLMGKLAISKRLVEPGAYPNWGATTYPLLMTGPCVTMNTDRSTEEQLTWLMRETPDYFLTYTSNLRALCEFSIEQGVRLQKLREVRTVSEAVTPDLRKLVMQAWGVPVKDVYSAVEVGYIALQCPDHEHYHIQAENLLLEVLKEDGQPCGEGETGRVVLTSLHNFAMPLIRYEIGDYAQVGKTCHCGRNLPVLTRIVGRNRNMARLPDNRKFWPDLAIGSWSSLAPIKQAQCIQLDLETLLVRLVPKAPLTSEQEKSLSEFILNKLGHPFRLSFEYTEAIERGPGGKFEDFICRLS